MFLPNTPRDAEEKRARAGTISERARDAEEKRARPNLAIATPTERASGCAEDARLQAGLK